MRYSDIKPIPLKEGLVKAPCKIGCEGCFYENEKVCPFDKCTDDEDVYIFVKEKNSKIKDVQKKKKSSALF